MIRCTFWTGVPGLALTNQEAWASYELWLANDLAIFAEEPPALAAPWRTLSSRASSSPKPWMDAYLPAFAITGVLQLVTFDRAFRQFPGLDVVVLGA